ncbi:uncharacterized protein F4822DRAFT_439593 [Hypoxylon trugodes]|uniref:uncharacterized protein n=1 Tax=Hypoxylon trugodes TaxID=326681 RepID=UPI0021951218|nr:uncharacterized protein F4822DRAFT_439593 [Hypoxylon trugodes]KAI1393514.1 hypothetical protein F4822DRAFT_439593 [Hypoxylon trugodes]
MTSPEEWAIPKGSTILITGVNGYIGSHITDQFLHYGFKLTNLFDGKYGKGRFELWRVPDLAAEGALNEVIKGVSAVIHSASIMNFDYDPDRVIPSSVAFGLNALKATYTEPGVKRFVYCSSSSASVISAPNRPGILVTGETWNDDVVKEAYAEPRSPTPEKKGAVYGASKVLTEQAIWKYHNEHSKERSDLVVNTVVPNTNIGKCLDPYNQGFPSSASLVVTLYWGEVKPHHYGIPRQYYINVQDTARLHIAAAIFDNVRSQRIFAFAGRFNWDAILDILRKLEPNKVFPENFSGGEDTNEIQPRPKAEQLLRRLGRPGWTSLEESVRDLV